MFPHTRYTAKNMTQTTLIYLIDASVYIFRAWFSIPDHMKTPQGQPCNAVFGFAGFLADLLKQTGSAPVFVAFDESLDSSYRNEIYPEYKANRPPAPEELKRQFAWCQQLCDAMGLHWQAHSRYEADDLIGTWGALARDRNHAVSIVTRDKDLTQLIQDGDHVWDFAGDKRLDGQAVEAQFGVRPDQIADYLALTGDAVDNIPGVAGVGPKAATALLQAFDNLEAIYQRLDEVPQLSVRGAKSLRDKLERDREQALMSQQLTRIPTDIDLEIPDLASPQPDAEKLQAFCDKLGFGSGVRNRLLAHVELSQ